MDDLERELQNYDDMGTSIEKIKNPGTENRELFRDLNTFGANKSANQSCTTCNVANNKFNINNFVQDLENNLDNFDNADTNIGPAASNQDFVKSREDFTENLINFQDDNEDDDDESVSSEEESYNYENLNSKVYKFLVNIKEPLIIVLLFILLNNREFITLTYKLPLIGSYDSPYPSLIIRGIILSAVIYYLRQLDKN
jgi:hypothetical protein